MSATTTKNLSCEKCDRTFKTPAARGSHMFKTHNIRGASHKASVVVSKFKTKKTTVPGRKNKKAASKKVAKKVAKKTTKKATKKKATRKKKATKKAAKKTKRRAKKK